MTKFNTKPAPQWAHWHIKFNNVTTIRFETFSLPTDAHNVKKHRVIKTF